MYWKEGEIFFTNRKEMLSRRPWIEGMSEAMMEDFTGYQCQRCGIWFVSTNPSTRMGAIICGICDKVVGG